jgi:hypothetical protein
MIEIKLLYTSMILYCNKLHLPKRNSLRVVSVKQNLNFNFQPPSTFILSWIVSNCHYYVQYPSLSVSLPYSYLNSLVITHSNFYIFPTPATPSPYSSALRNHVEAEPFQIIQKQAVNYK